MYSDIREQLLSKPIKKVDGQKFYLPFSFGEISKIALRAADAYGKGKPVRPLPCALLFYCF